MTRASSEPEASPTWVAEQKVVLQATHGFDGPLLQTLKDVDPTFTVNGERPFQARNAAQYEVEIMKAPSRTPHYPLTESLPLPVPLPEQEWLLLCARLSNAH